MQHFLNRKFEARTLPFKLNRTVEMHGMDVCGGDMYEDHVLLTARHDVSCGGICADHPMLSARSTKQRPELGRVGYLL